MSPLYKSFKSVISLSARIRKTLIGKRSFYQAEFGDESFFHTLSLSPYASNIAAIKKAITTYHSGETGDAYVQMARYFRNRVSPNFFVEVRGIEDLTKRLQSEYPGWKSGTLKRVRNDCEVGVPIYSTVGPRLDDDFLWDALPRSPGNDILYSRRLHRFAFAPRMALASLYGAPSASLLGRLLKTWISWLSSAKCADPYHSNLSVIQRLLALSWAWAFLAARPENEVDDGFESEITIIRVVHTDIQFLLPRLGQSYPNNHLLADTFAGWYISVLFPELTVSLNLRETYESLWLREIRRQTYGDGTSFEHSNHYHEFACEMAAAYILLSRRNNFDVPTWMLEHTKRMLRFQAEVGGVASEPLAIGDGIEDPLFALDINEGWSTAALREIYRALWCPECTPVPRDNPVVERAFWLLGGSLAPSMGRGGRSDVTIGVYEEGGFYVFRDSDCKTQLIFRTGPAPKCQLSGGHMHADILSVYLTICDVPMIVEAGTYTYRAQPDTRPNWRAYFMGPWAHNGLTIASVDPLSPLRSDFRNMKLTTRVATVNRHASRDIGWVEGTVISENSYADYRRGVIHLKDQYWLIYDLLPETVPLKQSSFGFQLAPGTQVAVNHKMIEAETDAQRLQIFASDGLEHANVYCGQKDPPAGWVSRRYGERTAAPQVRFGLDGSSRLTAFLLCSRNMACVPAHMEVNYELSDAVALRVEFETVEDYFILRHNSRSNIITAWGIQFDGLLLWLRLSRARPVSLRWYDGSSLISDRFGINIRARRNAPTVAINSTLNGVDVQDYPRDLLDITWPASAG